jgi:hypothetical protein
VHFDTVAKRAAFGGFLSSLRLCLRQSEAARDAASGVAEFVKLTLCIAKSGGFRAIF